MGNIRKFIISKYRHRTRSCKRKLARGGHWNVSRHLDMSTQFVCFPLFLFVLFRGYFFRKQILMRKGWHILLLLLALGTPSITRVCLERVVVWHKSWLGAEARTEPSGSSFRGRICRIFECRLVSNSMNLNICCLFNLFSHMSPLRCK